MPTVNSVTYNKPVLPRVSDTSDLASNRASVYSGKALSFDGVNDKVTTSLTTNIFQDQGTISCYLKLDDLTSSIHGGFGFRQNSVSEFYFLTLYSGNSELRLRTTSGVNDVVTSLTSFVNKWTMFTCTFGNGTLSLYANGVLLASNSYSGTFTRSASSYFIIGESGGDAFWLDGMAANAMVFDVALTATQVAELYNNPEQILPTGVAAVNLKLWLPMMEGAGSYVYNGAAGATGAELLANGTLEEVCQKWGLSDVSTIAITGGKIIWTNPASGGAFADQYISVSTGKTYRITFDYSASDGGFVYIGNQYTSIPSGTGTFTTDITYTSGDARLRIAYGSASALTASVDNVSVKEVVPQATGTISGATWVAGVGEPVAQTALIDWNKGTNLLQYSEGFDNAYWSKLESSVTANAITAPDGSNNGFSLIESVNNTLHQIQASGTLSTSVTYNISVFAKARSSNRFLQLAGLGLQAASEAPNYDLVNGLVSTATNTTTLKNATIEDAGNGWWRCSAEVYATGTSNLVLVLTNNFNNHAGPIYAGDGISGLCVWGAQVVQQASVGPYVSTAATAQSSPVLLPKGLTASKDILGNAIAKPRSAGAFNFDGASWAEVQDNASVDTVIPMTIEAWVYNNTGELSTSNRYMPIFDKATNYNGTSGFTLRVYSTFSTNGGYLGIGGAYSAFDFTDGSYQHIVAVIEPSSQKIYINGSLQNSFTNAWTVSTNSSPLRIGYTPHDNGQWLYGQIASPRVYNYALTANQVADNFNQKASTFGKSSVTSELQAYINRTVAAGATVEAHSALLNTLTELENK